MVSLGAALVCVRGRGGMYLYRYVQCLCGVVVGWCFVCVSCVFEICVLCGICVMRVLYWALCMVYMMWVGVCVACVLHVS